MHRGRPLRYALPLLVAGGILVWVFKDVSFKELGHELQQGHIGWIVLGMLLTTLAFGVRAYRWCLLLRATQAKISIIDSFWALMAGYLVNFAVPRAGELFRSGILKKRHNLSFAQALGTVISERLLDIVCMGIFIALSFWIEQALLQHIGKQLLSRGSVLLWLLYIGIAIVVGLGLYLFLCRYQPKLWLHVKHFGQDCWKSLLSIRKTEPIIAFHSSTCLLWGLYYLSNYAFMQAYSETAVLPLYIGIVLLATSSIGMLIPIQGGLGSFHVLVSHTFMWYGVPQSIALAITVTIHLGYTIIVALFGVLALLFFFRQRE